MPMGQAMVISILSEFSINWIIINIGVGYFLNVHEGPIGISKYRYEVLKEGMIVSNGKNNIVF